MPIAKAAFAVGEYQGRPKKPTFYNGIELDSLNEFFVMCSFHLFGWEVTYHPDFGWVSKRDFLVTKPYPGGLHMALVEYNSCEIGPVQRRKYEDHFINLAGRLPHCLFVLAFGTFDVVDSCPRRMEAFVDSGDWVVWELGQPVMDLLPKLRLGLIQKYLETSRLWPKDLEKYREDSASHF